MKAHFEMMAAYNAWANRRLYAAALAMPENDFRADLGAFFGSVMGTLNHIMVGDLIWLARFREQPKPPFGLDHILHEDGEDLAAARKVLDDDIIAYIAGQSDQSIADSFTYTMMTTGETVSQPRAPALTHFFNHQTHHRGQVHALLTRVTGEAPALDLVYYQREAS
ncbi:MAG: DinB family protein [Pseudomonadota bacterium]